MTWAAFRSFVWFCKWRHQRNLAIATWRHERARMWFSVLANLGEKIAQQHANKPVVKG